MWKIGDRLRHRFNAELGPGRVTAVDGRQVEVSFPEAGEILRLAARADALEALVLAVGTRVRVERDGRTTIVDALSDDGRYRLQDGSLEPIGELWPIAAEVSPLDRLLRGEVDEREDFVNRLDALRLMAIREADGLGSFLGGRIRLFPHQLYAAEQACGSDPVRWLLADEVGLGKTVEACLVMNRLLYSGRADRVLVVAPDTLVVQWLGELWRKYHQVFVLIDESRLRDVSKEHGSGANPFDVYPRAIVALETLVDRPMLSTQAAEAGLDLLVVDEAHRLRRRPGHPGEPGYRAVAPLAEAAHHALMLSATPLEEDAESFFRLLQLLRPDAVPDERSLDAWAAGDESLPPCVSAARRSDVGGLPPRVAQPVVIEPEDWEVSESLIEHLGRLPATNAHERRRKAKWVTCALASPPAVASRLAGDEEGARRAAEAAAQDPRLTWLVAQARAWHDAGDKTLVFVAHRESLDAIKVALTRSAIRVGLFHEDLSPQRRDLEVAQFRLPEGPSILISTEAGGEGRNFDFCRRLVLHDLPFRPAVVEQRIGRLDRIGRTRPTEIVYFRPPSGLGRTVVALYERLGLFERPLSGVAGISRFVARTLDAWAVRGEEITDAVVDEALAALPIGGEGERSMAYRTLYRAPYRAELAEEILSRVPARLDSLTADVVLRAAARFGFTVEEIRAGGVWSIELAGDSLVDGLPGVPGGSRFQGTFDRELAVDDEGLDFFATGHPLIEGVLGELADGPRGRVALLRLDDPDATAPIGGLLALYRRGDDVETLAVDPRGKRCDALADRLLRQPGTLRRLDPRLTKQPGFAKGVGRMAGGLPSGRTPEAVALFQIRPASGVSE